MARGLLIVFSGPSGVGKGTVRALFADREELNIAYSISMTSRAKREGETDGVEYHFVTREEFEQAIANDELLEYAEFVGNYYGTPKAFVERLRDEGKNVLLEIEVEGATIVKEKCPDALSIFLIPPSMEELERRIRGRKTEPEEVVQQRLAKAQREMNMMNRYQYVICNDDAELAADIIALIIERYAKAKQQEEEQ
ncbi:MAG: guanylate kinase [Erysipelotrichaceae bacterium]|nr:guanylate kinase [Erysipelotrichaceae bacterium]